MLTNDYFINTIDSLASVLEESQTRNYQRWPILGTYVWPNQYVGQTYADEINFLKQWILDRLAWMDTNMPGNCDLITAVEDSRVDLAVFPNPFHDVVTISSGAHVDGKQIQIFNVLGQEILKAAYTGNEFYWRGISTEGKEVGAGIYFLRISNSRGVLLKQVKVIRHH